MSRYLVVSSCTKRKKNHRGKAADLYRGEQHLLVKEGVALLRERHKTDWQIISAQYGLIRDDHPIAPYERSFTTMKRKEIRQRSRELGIEEKLKALVERNLYEKVFFLLGTRYLTAIEAFIERIPVRAVFFTTRSIPGADIVRSGIEEAKRHKKSVISLKGYLFLEYIKKEKKDLSPD